MTYAETTDFLLLSFSSRWTRHPMTRHRVACGFDPQKVNLRPN